MKFILLIITFLNIYNFSFGDTPDSTKIKLDISAEQLDFTDDLDSLLQSWYVRNYVSIAKDTVIDTAYEKVELNDSILQLQLKNIVSPFPLDYNDRVKAFINLYINKRHEQVSYMLGLSEYYFPMFEAIFDKYDIPLELKYLAIIESALNPRAVSRAGATGLWQFMYSTGKIYKLEINSYVDERRDPVKSTEAAAQFLSNLYTIYGDWTLVIAAYNCGPGNVNKAIRRSGGKKNFWEIYYRLPRETRGYVPAFIAATYVFHYYQDYNIEPVKMDLPIMTDTINIDENLHFGQVSEMLNIPIELLRELNPQYKKDIIPARADRIYSLKIPQEYSLAFIDKKDTIFTHNDSLFFKTKAVIAPKKYERGGVTPPPSSKNMKAVTYTIKAGDNLGFISSWYNVRVSDIKYWNNIYRNNIRAGKQLTIYVPKSKASYYSKIDKMSFEEKQKRIGKSVTSEPKPKTKAQYDKNADYVYYTVKNGDNFWSIAKKYPGVSNTDIMNLNGISDAGSLKVGQRIRIKRK